MTALIEAEGEKQSDNPRPGRRHRRRSNRKSKKTASPLEDDNFFSSLLSDANDNDFAGENSETGSGSDPDSSGLDSDVNVEEITNEEVTILEILLKQLVYSLSSSWHPFSQQKLFLHQVAVLIQMLATYGRKANRRQRLGNVPRVRL
jgi:hypothetical protein